MAKSSNLQNHLAVDEKIKQGYTDNAMNEGFAAASGVRPETAESGGRLAHPETKDNPRQKSRISNHFEDENAGLADN